MLHTKHARRHDCGRVNSFLCHFSPVFNVSTLLNFGHPGKGAFENFISTKTFSTPPTLFSNASYNFGKSSMGTQSMKWGRIFQGCEVVQNLLPIVHRSLAVVYKPATHQPPASQLCARDYIHSTSKRDPDIFGLSTSEVGVTEEAGILTMTHYILNP
ncbi:hypothetical protein A0H81_00944 [Grifola frondosa]|uniref:Uncharacterized protein n=1 Tax=Grifola frondosa TaxID=5627 RepID=A0A1C7MS56_GRIFR|nr:hypothetical protein A0H81_00944 [Grifola frondosa]